MQKKIRIRHISSIIGPFIAILLAFLIAGLVVLISGENPLMTYSSLFRGAFGSSSGIKNTIRYTLPIIFLALSFSLTERCGFFNIGQDGQLLAASIMITSIPIILPNASSLIQLILMIFTGALIGAVVALIPALFRIWLGIHEVIIAILLNYLILHFSSYLLVYSKLANPDSSYIMSNPIEPSIGPSLIIGFVILVVLLYTLSLQHSVPGYQLRMVGKNRRFAILSGIKANKIVIFASIIAGALSGLVASGELLGVYHIMYDNYAAGMGNNGIMAAIIGQYSPIGIMLSSLVLGSLQSGSVRLSVATDVPAEIVIVVQGFVMLFATVNIKTVIKKFTGKSNGFE